MLTQTSNLPPMSANSAVGAASATVVKNPSSVSSNGPSFKLASRANHQNSTSQILDEHNLDSDMPPTSPQIMPRPASHHNSIHGITLNQSIYANTVTLPKINSAAVRHGSNGSSGSSGSGKSVTNTGLNTSKLSSSNSPATTNQTKTSYMDSSRDHSHHELESTTLSPIMTKNSTASRPNLTSHSPPLLGNGYINNSAHASNTSANNTSRYSQRLQMNSTAVNTNTKKLNASALLPANVSKFMLLSKEAGLRADITYLALLCLVSLLFALLSLVFLLKISPSSKNSANSERRNYQFEFLTPSQFDALYDVTLALCALTLVLNLCCLVVCAIQFLFAVKLVKSPQGRQRTAKYLKGAASTRGCAIGGFFFSIPLFLTGVVLYTFLHFDSVPSIVASVFVGLGIVFCGAAVVHNVFVWQKEKTANVTKSLSNSPVLARTQNGKPSVLDGTSKTNTIGGLPQATLDLSGPNSRVLELSTLV